MSGGLSESGGAMLRDVSEETEERSGDASSMLRHLVQQQGSLKHCQLLHTKGTKENGGVTYLCTMYPIGSIHNWAQGTD